MLEVRSRAEARGVPAIHVGPFDGLHLEVFTRMLGARNAVEIGTLAGYSGLCILRGLREGGRLYTFEFEPLHAEVARETFARNGFGDHAEILVGPALENLAKIEKHGPFDLVFIDADKVSYPRYFEWAARNLRVGGAILGDNTFAFGMIGDDAFDDAEDRQTVESLRVFNEKAATDARFRSTILPTGEGLTVAVKIRDL